MRPVSTFSDIQLSNSRDEMGGDGIPVRDTERLDRGGMIMVKFIRF